MGLLDDLKKQAGSLREEEQKEESRRQRLLQSYRAELKPKITQIYNYLVELTDQLNYIKPDVKTSYDIKNVGVVSGLQQAGYVVSADSTTAIRVVKLAFSCAKDDLMTFRVRGAAAIQEQLRYMLNASLRADHKQLPGGFHGDHEAEFRFRCVVPVTILFEVDVENSKINMNTSNFESIGTRTFAIPPEEIDDRLCEEFGRYLLRQVDNFRQAKLSDAERMRLAKLVEEERAARERELNNAVFRALAEASAPVAGGLKGVLKKVLKGT
jgi:hypothetical protein